MERFFLELLNRAICAGWLVSVILLIRVTLKKVPKWVRCLLWGMVAVRLLVPIQIESLFSLIPSAQTVSPDVMYAEKPELHTGIGVVNSTVNPVISDHFSPRPEDSVNPLQVLTGIASWVWLTGMAIMLIYAVVSYVRLRFLVRTAVLAGGDGIPVLESERVASPFVLGLIRPRIYLQTKVDGTDRDYIISHEMAHIHRKDHWIKPFGYVLLAVYWFHPLLWAAYIMLCRDIEYACDERVVKHYNVEERKAYSTALLACSVRRIHIAACPVAFGEVGVRQRVKSVLHYKKPAFWVLAAAALCCVFVAVCFLTNPKAEVATGTEDGNASAGTTGTEGGNASAGTTGTEDGNAPAGAADPENGNDPAGVAVPAEGRYVFDRCIYMNPLSSYIPMEGQEISGYLDADGMTWDEFGVQKRFLFEKADESANVDTMPWTVFEAEELKDAICRAWDGTLFGKIDARLEAIGELPAKKRLWRPLEDGHRLLYVDGELWLMRDGKESGVWSIYALRPQAEDGLSDAIAKAAWDWAVETGAFGSVPETGSSGVGVTGEEWVDYPCVSYVVLATEGSFDAATGENETVTVYAHVLATAFRCERTGLTELGGSYIPAAITFSVNEDGSYTLSEYWTPRDGSYYVQDIRDKFLAPEVADAAIDGQRYILALIQECYAKAVGETSVVDIWSVVRGLFDDMLMDRDGLLEEDADAVTCLAAYPLTVRELCYYGTDTLRYIYNQFMQGGESGLRGELMVRVMDELISEEVRLRMPLNDGQAYFDALCDSVRKCYADLVFSQGGEAEAKRFMRENMPAQYLLLHMLEIETFDAEAVRVSESTENASTIAIGASEADDIYEYYLTKEELMADIEHGYLFRVDTRFSKPQIPHVSGGNEYTAPYVSLGIWPFYVYEDNIVNLEIAFSNLLMKPNKNIFPGDEQIIVEMISPDGLSVYRFEKVGEEITKDTSIQEQISVTPGEWTLKISFAYVCGETPAHLRIAAAYETPSEEDLNWLKRERLTNGEGL